MSDETPTSTEPESKGGGLKDRVTTWPYLVRVEMIGAMLTMLVLIVWSIVVDAPLEAPANPTLTPNPAKAPWYFVGLQEILVYFDPWIAGVMLPGLIIAGLIAIPYVDPNPRGSGYYTWSERRFAIGTFLFGFLGLWVLPIVVGVFFRGPGWGWYWPWESWETAHELGVQAVNLSELLGIPDGPLAFAFGAAVVLGWYGLGGLYWWRRQATLLAMGLDARRYAVVAFLFLSMMGVPAKIVLRLALDVHYVWVTPWFNI